MCADHRNRVALAAILDEFFHLKISLRFSRGHPNLPPRYSIRIIDPVLFVRHQNIGFTQGRKDAKARRAPA